jgi:hypothetical protein
MAAEVGVGGVLAERIKAELVQGPRTVLELAAVLGESWCAVLTVLESRAGRLWFRRMGKGGVVAWRLGAR